MSKLSTRNAISCNIRLARHDDASEIEFIEDAAHKFPLSIQRIEHISCARSNIFIYVAENKGMVLGFALVRLHAGCVQIITMGVHPDYRRAGIGSQILTFLRKKLSKDRRKIIIRVHENDFKSMKFLMKNGFIMDCRLADRYIDGSDMYQMEYIHE